MSYMLRSLGISLLLAISICSSSCGLVGRSMPANARDRELSLFVRNQNFYDATLYAIGPGGMRQRLGTVTGNTEETLRFRWSRLELRIEIDLLSVGSTLTEPLPVDEGDELELIINHDLHRRIP